MKEGFFFSTTSPALWVIAVPTVARWYLIAVLICISLIASEIEYHFILSVGHLCVFLGEVSVQILGPFFN